MSVSASAAPSESMSTSESTFESESMSVPSAAMAQTAKLSALPNTGDDSNYIGLLSGLTLLFGTGLFSRRKRRDEDKD
ncbi:LPXTG cell wall anchor domain-containing protein [Streptococcus suis]|nr:LPXTG cell wall anchor domain-containing protein [Streptococcus suis]